jgi:DNA-binding winged helix-turn-helix (wHTH) protein
MHLMQHFRVDDVEDDVPGNRLLRGELEVRVEPKVMRVLCSLAASAGEVVRTETLLETVWAGQVVEDDALSAAVFKLRKAFADDARQPRVIATAHRVGYRLSGGRAAGGFRSPRDGEKAAPAHDSARNARRQASSWRLQESAHGMPICRSGQVKGKSREMQPAMLPRGCCLRILK